MNYRLPLIRICSLAVVALWLGGCASTPAARFYTLTPMAPQQTGQTASEGRKVAVNVAPVELPDYLNRLQIVTRDGRNELKLAEFDRWAGSLSENMALVLAENLALLLGSEQVFSYPRVQSAAPDYTVALRVLQLDCIPGDQVQLKAQWTLLAGADRKEAATRVTTFTEKLRDKQYITLAAGISRTFEKLSTEVAREIDSQSAGKL